MPIWRPSVVCNLQLRFDEAFNVLEDDSPPAATVAGAESGGSRMFGPPVVRPLILSGAKDKLSQVGGRQPKSGTIELNGLRQAHTFDLVFDFRDLPIDVRLIRDVRIEIFLGLVTASNFATGVTRAQPDGSRSSIIDTTLSSVNRTNLLFVGMADDADTEHTEHGSWLHIKGRDLRGMLIDAKADPRIFKDLDLSKPINDVVLQILTRLPFGKNINVYIQPQEWPNGVVPSPATADGVTRVRRGADGKANPMSSPQGEGDKIGFWDLITKYCTLVGAVPYFVGKDIRIRQVRSLYQQVQWNPSRPTPFVNGKPRVLKLDGKQESISVRRFVYGRDLMNVKFSRKFRGQKSPVIECVSIDTSSSNRGLGKLVIARWPANTALNPKKAKFVERAAKTSVSPSGQESQTEVLRFPIAGIKSKTVLQEIARNLYEEIGRNELGGSASTRDFSSFSTDADPDPDLITLFPGDAVQFAVDKSVLNSRSPMVSELIKQQRQSFGEAVSYLTQRLGDANLARVLVATARNSVVELQDTFRTKVVKYTVADGGAVAIDFDFENYIEVRSGAVNPDPPTTSAPPTGKTS